MVDYGIVFDIDGAPAPLWVSDLGGALNGHICFHLQHCFV